MGVFSYSNGIQTKSIHRIVRRGLPVALLLCAIVGTSYIRPASATTPPDSCFAFTAGTGTITDYYNNEGNNGANPACPREVDIPSTIGGVAVTRIGVDAFERNSLSSATIPSSVTRIDASAFSNNLLTTITIPASVTNIGNMAFSRNSFTNIVVQGNPATLGTNIFEANKVPISSISYNGTLHNAPVGQQVLPTTCLNFNVGTATIQDYYYADLVHIRTHGNACLATDIVIPGTISATTVTAIGSLAFTENNLSAAVIPNSVTMINTSAFRDNSITSVVISPSVAVIGAGAFENNQLTSLSLPDSVTSIGFASFWNNQISSLQIGSGLTTITTAAFGRNQLQELSLPDTVTVIEGQAFTYNNMHTLDLGAGVQSILGNAFRYNRIAEVRLPSSLVSLSDYAFEGQTTMDGNTFQEIVYGSCVTDCELVREALDTVFFAKIYTADESNPNNIKDRLVYDMIESNGDNSWDDIELVGGHIVNPAEVNMAYTNSNNQELSQSVRITGETGDNRYLLNYILSEGPSFPTPVDPWDRTPAEVQAIADAMSAYYRIGDEVTITPPAIDGYVTPPTQSFVLGAASNTFSYVYSAASSSTTPIGATSPSSLARTGSPIAIYISGSVGMAIIGWATLAYRRRW